MQKVSCSLGTCFLDIVIYPGQLLFFSKLNKWNSIRARNSKMGIAEGEREIGEYTVSSHEGF